jgi:HIRAN domain
MGASALQACMTLAKGSPLILVREPGNPSDGNAIKLLNITGTPVGYVQREVAAIVRQWMDIGMAVSGKVIRGPRLTNGRITMKKRYPRAVIYAEPPAEEGLSTGVRANVKRSRQVSKV